MSELKQVATSISNVGASTCDYIQFFPNMPQGAGDNQRIGNRVATRYFSFRLRFAFTPGAQWANATPLNLRLYVVWPRDASRSDALSLINETNFPTFGLQDQDNFIIWKKQDMILSNGSFYGERRFQWVKFAKRFIWKAEFKQGTDTQPMKMPYLVISSNYLAGQQNYSVVGYVKVSYRDI